MRREETFINSAKYLIELISIPLMNQVLINDVIKNDTTLAC